MITNQNISWSQFEICNQDSRVAFENMCRLLFNRFFFHNQAILHSNPNNPGIEVLPTLEVKTNKRISFQSKYFSSTDYSQIMHSVEQTIKYYSGEIDILYLYCNKDLTTTSKSYKNIEAKLNAVNIELVSINNQTILNQVVDHPVIASLYFNHHGLTHDWFNEQLKVNLESLGARYNEQFNVNTKTEEYINIFSKNREAVALINQKKTDTLNEIQNNRWAFRSHDNLLEKFCDYIGSINDITQNTILESLNWSTAFLEKFANDIAELNTEIEMKKQSSEKELDKKNRSELEREIRQLEYLLDISSLLEFNEIEKNLLIRKVLIIQGDAGIGKSQLYANASEKTIQENGCALLLLGQSYLSGDHINLQIPVSLGLDFGIDELLNVLECAGEEKNQCSLIFIDAINESGNKDIWKSGLNQLVNKVDRLNYVRLAISVRTGYEILVFDDAIQQKIKSQEMVRLVHTGFREESIEATKTFLNYYHIPFSPSYILQYEMTNPLFLILFCKTYTGENFDISTLFENIIRKTDREAQNAVGFDSSSEILKYLVNEIAEYFLCMSKRSITKKDLLELGFWNTYGLSNNKIPFISAVEKAGLFISSAYNGIESYFLGYNLLEDFVCAKLIIEKYSDKESLREYLQNNLLEIKNGKITNYLTRDIFIVVCGLYAEKYNEDFIDIIDSLSDDIDKYHIIESYVDSFLWRKSSAVNADAFTYFLNKYNVNADKTWRIFIENSIKTNHPLNAELLHNILLKKSISQRDYLWTTYINGFSDEEERLFQLITFFDKGNSLDGLTDENICLMLILFAWLLTSSNRFLRDKTSKAMIELLKSNFQMCKPLLKMFEIVDDPYVIQRLYGVIFGATMKRTQKYEAEFKELSEYIFNAIFDKDMVYPDILLRDYARLILERWTYEFPNSNVFDIAKIKPPYKSVAIPIVEKQKYYDEDVHNSGLNSIDRSIKPNCADVPGMYGDFGRYVFESAVRDFDEIDLENLYHYAMQFIRDELGYTDKLFGNYDTFERNYRGRHETKKIERIGKKYQWIAMYNILARISDTHLIKSWNDEGCQFEGAWEPYVRDFDPTLNCNFLLPSNLPCFEFSKMCMNEFYDGNSYDESKIKEWTEANCNFFNKHSLKLMINDTEGKTWILLNQFEKVKNAQHSHGKHSIYFDKGSQEMWSMSHSYIVKQDEFDVFKRELEQRSFLGRWFPEGQDAYQLYNREYVWSPGYKIFFEDTWVDYEIDTDEKIVTKHSGSIPKIMSLLSEDDDDVLTFEEKEWEQVEIVKKILGRVMPTYSRILWEEQYNASQEETTSFDIPCKDILNSLRLEQKEYDGYFYSEDGTLVAFDGNLSDICDGLLIRKDYLDRYLEEHGLRLFWACLGEKQYFNGDSNQIWGDWSGFLYLDGNKINGNVICKKVNL